MRPGSERHPSWHVVAGRCFRAPATSSWARCTRSYAVVAGGQIPPSVAGPLPCGLPACALAAAAAAAMRGTRVVVTVQLDTSTYRTALCGWVPMSKGQGVIVCIKDLSPDDQAKKSNESGWLARDGHIPFDGGLLEYSSRNIHLADRSISARLASFRETTSTTVFFLEPRVANGSKFQHTKLGVHVIYCKHRKVHKTQPCKHVFCNSTSGKS